MSGWERVAPKNHTHQFSHIVAVGLKPGIITSHADVNIDGIVGNWFQSSASLSINTSPLLAAVLAKALSKTPSPNKPQQSCAANFDGNFAAVRLLKQIKFSAFLRVVCVLSDFTKKHTKSWAQAVIIRRLSTMLAFRVRIFCGVREV